MLNYQRLVFDAIKSEKQQIIKIEKKHPKVLFLSYDTNKLLFNLIFNNELLGMKVYVVENIKDKKFLLSHGSF